MTLECAIAIFGAELVARSKKYRFFKKNLRVRVEDLLDLTALADAPLATQKVTELMNSVPDFINQPTVSLGKLKEIYSNFRKENLDQFSELSFLSGEEIAFLLHCGVSSVYGAEGFPQSVEEGFFQVKRWPIKSVVAWAEKAIYIPPPKPKKENKKKTKTKSKSKSKAKSKTKTAANNN